MADIAQLTTLTYEATAVTRITSMSGPAMSNPIVDVSDLDDTAREKISSGLFDGGQLTLGLNFEADAAMHDLLTDDCIAGLSKECVITFPDAGSTVYTFTAFPVEVTPTANVGEQLTASVTLDVTGTVAIT